MTERIVSLTAARVRELLDYDPVSGQLRWKLSRRGSHSGKGGIVGWANDHGFGVKYARVCIDGVKYYAHRVAWLYVHGEWPSGNLDHRNGDSDGIENLRSANQTQNIRNAAIRSDNTSGFKGVMFRRRVKERRRDRWIAVVVVNGKRQCVASCGSAIEAAIAYDAAAVRLFGEFARTNKMLGLLP